MFNIQPELRKKPKRVKLCRPLRLLNMSVMKDLQRISCCGLTVPCRAARCPIPNWGMITSRSVSENTSQTRHPQHASETLGADDMWHAIMQIAKVNVTHFLAYERQFLSLFSEQALSLHNIRRAFPQISCAEPMERQRHHFTSLGMEKKEGGKQTEEGTSGHHAWQWGSSGLTHLKIKHKSLHTEDTNTSAVSYF